MWDLNFVSGYIVGGEEFTLEELKAKIEPLGDIVGLGERGFRLSPHNRLYPATYFNPGCSVDFITKNLYYTDVMDFIEELTDVIGLPIEHSGFPIAHGEDHGEGEKEKLEKFFEAYGGKYGKAKQSDES